MALTQQTEAVKAAIATLGTRIKTIQTTANNAPNAQKLEGNSLQDIVDLIVGTTGATIQDVETALNTFIARNDNPHGVTKAQVGLGNVQDFGMATKVEAEEGVLTDRYVSPKTVKDAISYFWADKVGAAPETLDTIDEIATAITSNQDVITSLNDAVANRALTSDLNTAVTNLQNAISALTKADIGLSEVENFGVATTTEAQTGTADNKYMTPLKTQQAIDQESAALQQDIDSKTAQTDHDALQTQVNDLDKADIGLANVLNYSVASEAEALVTDTQTVSNMKYMTPARTLAVRQAIDVEINTALGEIETAFNDAIAAIDA
jgi:hypothetical protein